MAAQFNIGDIVWAKLSSFPPWPSKIVRPKKDIKKPKGKKPVYFVFFYGTEDHAWVKAENLKPFEEYKDQMIKANKGKRFHQAVEAVEAVLRKGGGAKRGRPPKHSASPKSGPYRDTDDIDHEEVVPSSKPVQKTYSREPLLGKTVSPSTSIGLKRPPESLGAEASIILKRPREDNESDLYNFDESEHETESDIVTSKDDITPTCLKIGFLGLGIMGSGMVRNLIKTGHSVMVWNRTPMKCRDLVQAGASVGGTVNEVVAACDITFGCVADPNAVRDLVFGTSGVLQSIRPGKAYVEMSTIDVETVQDVAESIESRGGRFLEAPVIGTRKPAEDGMLVIVAGGDRSLFDDCESCFLAMGKKAFYLGEIGSGTRMKLVANMVLGSVMAGYAEGMSLAERAGLDLQTVLDVFKEGPLNCAAVRSKGDAILHSRFEPSFPLKHQQKDMRLALALGDELKQSLPVAAAANEMFKRAISLGNGDNDMSSVYRATAL
ncbi:PREDICTED: glyoxylate/succinic semialdehyde reductase 1-like isoform X2 [Branchiostoma belcheri]|uniref:Cytokine-like nuclear factor N-PAC n=1 Tax=Branchiostoma belcheri TaxID=7741 RepID=A0A6P4ZEQ6_BRABE|nr:PREDICTED: glyoxylate/succinic semialdehyde reductase 1-like isoform X2 [Branchiostoma belcheri]